MKVVLTNPNESARCTWCNKDRECVTATFSDRFLIDAPLCIKCLHTAIKVRSKQVAGEDADATKLASRQAETPGKQ